MTAVNKKNLPQTSGYIKSLTLSKYFVIVDVQTTFPRQFDLPTYLSPIQDFLLTEIIPCSFPSKINMINKITYTTHS